MKMFAAITTAALTVAILPIGCATSDAAKASVTNPPVPATTQRAADAIIYISGMS